METAVQQLAQVAVLTGGAQKGATEGNEVTGSPLVAVGPNQTAVRFERTLVISRSAGVSEADLFALLRTQLVEVRGDQLLHAETKAVLGQRVTAFNANFQLAGNRTEDI